jgi:hypothetical protein
MNRKPSLAFGAGFFRLPFTVHKREAPDLPE